MFILKAALVVLATVAIGAVNAKPQPSHHLHHGHYDLHSAIPDHFDITPPVLPAPHFHTGEPFAVPEPHHDHHHPHYPQLHTAVGEAVLPPPHFHANFLEPTLPVTAPAFFAGPPAPAFVPAPLPAPVLPAPVLPAPVLPAPVLPAPVVHTPFVHSHLLPAVTRFVPPVLEAVPFTAPTYRAIPGPKTTTTRVSVGYAFPAPSFAKIVSVPHHHHHHHSLF